MTFGEDEFYEILGRNGPGLFDLLRALSTWPFDVVGQQARSQSV
jgi:hypothetical protein